MQFDEKVFKSYDVRGVYPETINEDLAKKIGSAFVIFFKLKKVGIGRDGRLSSKKIEDALAQGAKEAGADVIRFGLIATDMIYFASAYYDDIDGAINVTASHNPKDNNGFKFTLSDAVAVNGEDGLYKMRDLILENKIQKADKMGQESSRDIYNNYVEKINSLVNVKKIKPLKIVVDAGNGVGGFIFKKVINNLPIQMVPLYCEVDGNFPNHQPDTLEEKNFTDLKKKIIDEKADLGLFFDGDGDRVSLVDEKGKIISGTVMTAIIARRMLDENPGARILYNVICGWIVPETVQANGGTSSITKVGHSLIKAQMREEDGTFAGEHSGHYYFKDLYYADSAMLASLIILEIISENKKPLSEIAMEYDKYFLSGEINFKVANKEIIIDRIKEKYNDGKQSELDGLSVEYADWRVNVRPSNTEPLLRLNVEAKTKELMDQKIKEFVKLIEES